MRTAPARYFNTAGPCDRDEHYMLPPERRLGRPMELIEQARWFVLAAGRQTGKTTSLRWLAEHYKTGDGPRALLVDIQAAREIADVPTAVRSVLSEFDRWIELLAPDLARPDAATVEGWLATPTTALVRYVSALCAASERPLALLIDEADGLVGAAMVSFLTQLRALYISRRAAPAPASVVLVGMRAIRDYTLSQEDRRAVTWLGTSSPFNVTAELVTLASFTRADVAELLAQHTAATGQRFEDDAVERVWFLSQGHAWLVNALADYAVDRLVRDRATPVTAACIDAAKDAMILDRRTHLDSLFARLQEPRVRRVLDPVLAGGRLPFNDIDADLQYVVGLGLLRKVEGRWEVANPIYREVIPRALTSSAQESLDQPTAWYVGADGLLDVPKLMTAWQTFWRKDGHLAAEGFSYKESGPHLMLMAFLQRVVNGGGRIEREYALGKGALDLLVAWKTQRVVVETKLRRDTETEDEAHEQIVRYLDALGLREGWLVLFDLRATAPWSERLFQRDRLVDGRTIHVIGC